MTAPIKKTPSRWLTPMRWGSGIILVLSILVFTLALLTYLNKQNNFDDYILDKIRTLLDRTLTNFLRPISFLGNIIVLVAANILLLVIFIIRKDKWAAWRIAVLALTSFGLLELLKALFQRNRPHDPILDVLYNFSFPSGHAFMTVSFFGFLICWGLVVLKEKWKKIVLTAVLILLIISIGLSRLYLRMHHPTDVIAGWGLGTAWLIFVLLVIDKIASAREKIT